MIFDPDPKTATVNVRLLAADLPSQGDRSESIEALVELPWTSMSRRYVATHCSACKP